MKSKRSSLPTPEIKTGPYANIELLPVPREKKTRGIFSYISLWLNSTACVTSFMVGSSLIMAGLDLVASLIILSISTFIMSIFSTLIAHPGTKYGISYPVQARSVFGLLGSHIPSFIRGLVAAGWYGILLWIGGSALDSLVILLIPIWRDVPFHAFYWFIIFLITCLFFTLCYNPRKSKKHIQTLNTLSTSLLLISGIVWCIFLYLHFSQEGTNALINSNWNNDLLIKLFVAISFHWSTLTLNASDHSRFARSQQTQIVGQISGLVLGQFIFAGIGIYVSYMSLIIFNQPIWNPVENNNLTNLYFNLMLLFSIMLASLKTALIVDISSINLALINLFPKTINWFRATVISTTIAILIQPWNLLRDWQSYLYTWIDGYGIFFGAIIGILLTDYFLINKRKLLIQDLYLKEGRYWYYSGINLNSLCAFIISVIICYSGLFYENLSLLYYAGPYLSIVISSLVYIIARIYGSSNTKL